MQVTDSGGLTYDEVVAVALTNANDAPSFGILNATPTFVEDDPAVVLDADVEISDPELEAAPTAATVTTVVQAIVRQLANADDVLSFIDDTGITLVGGNLIKNGQIIASFDSTSTPGELVITFTDANGQIPTSADVDNILRQITYANSSDTPPASVQLDWTFNDGNSGGQGSGGALQATGSTTVNITATNDAPTFDVGTGAITHDLTTDTDTAYAVALQDDGKLIVVGEAWNGSELYDFAVMRLNADGTRDTSFGVAGQVLLSFASDYDQATDVWIQPDGKILVGGYSYMDSGSVTNDFTLVRLNTDGTLDTSFDGDGKLVTDIGGTHDWAYSLTVQNDGKILMAGSSRSSNDDFALVRYNSDGSLDTGFGGGDGIATTPIGGGDDTAYDIAVQDDGKILLTGTDGSNLVVVRYDSVGTLDPTFGTGGIVTTDVGSGEDVGNSITVQSDGKIVVAGVTADGGNFDFVVTRYETDGTLDATFGTGGVVTTAIGAGADRASSVAILPDGKILVTGSTHNGTDYDVALVRYDSNGSLDSGFGTGGLVIADIGGTDDTSNQVTIQDDGKIIVVGDTYGTDTDFLILRYNSDGTLDTDFAPATTLNGSPTFVEGGAAVVLDADVQIFDAELSAIDNFNGTTLTLVRNGGANSEDALAFDGVNVTTSGADVVVGGVTAGTYTFTGGELTISFGSNATNVLVNTVMQNIVYWNNSDAPPASVQIDWTFDDGGNTVQTQGGAALQATGSTTVNITAVNDAPVLDDTATPVLGAVNEDAGAPSGAVGTLVSNLVDFATPAGQVDNVTDADSGALLGIAITAANTTNGTVWYSTDNGSTWNALGAVSGSSARLLAADANTRVYFQANANFNGTISDAITFRAWDQTSGVNGGTGNAVGNAGTYLDQFNAVSYSNNDGSLSWGNNWVESDLGGSGASGGVVYVDSGELVIATFNTSTAIYRQIDLSGAASARSVSRTVLTGAARWTAGF
ncbi:MAG: hypothetical protein R3C49_06750 [Planctomycetaceae bacterium]